MNELHDLIATLRKIEEADDPAAAPAVAAAPAPAPAQIPKPETGDEV
jgi:hypothetical protein